MVNILDGLRERSICDILQTNSVSKAWPRWKEEINKILNKEYTPSTILDISDNLSTIFKKTSESGRSQSNLKGAGVGWEGLVGWYLNLCLLGSRTVVFKMKKDTVPEPIRDAMTVLYGTFASNSESDLLAITFPKHNEYKSDLTKEQETKKGIKKLMDDLTEEHFSEYEVGIIQCKTNWNDNAQIPMLWDMVYHAKGFRDRNITVGKNNYSIDELHKFSYSFVTVPSSKKDISGPSCTPVNRVSNISGGNYWGMPSENGIANSLKEIFSRNFSGGNTKSLRADMKKELRQLNSKYSYFDLE